MECVDSREELKDRERRSQSHFCEFSYLSGPQELVVTRSRFRGQGEIKRAALADLAGGPSLTTVGLDNVLHD